MVNQKGNYLQLCLDLGYNIARGLSIFAFVENFPVLNLLLIHLRVYRNLLLCLVQNEELI